MEIERQSPRHDPTGYEEVWPDIAARLDAALRQRGTPKALRDDLVQETAARLWERWPSVDTRTDVFPLALIIARNLATDAARKDGRVELRSVIERTGGEDPAAIASARIELGQALRMVMSLAPRYRDLLLAEAGLGVEPAGEAGGVVTNMARMRARRRLRTMIERVGAAVVMPWKRLMGRISSRRTSAQIHLGHSLSSCMLEVAIACVLTLVGSGAITGLADNEAPRSSYTTTAAARGGSEPLRHLKDPHRAAAFTTATAAGRDGTSNGTVAAAASQLPLDKIPHGKGSGEETGSFGLEGYDLGGSGDAEVEGHGVKWEHRHQYGSPKCVSSLAEGEVSTDCSGGRPPRGSAEVEWDGNKTRVDYGQ